jgi:hypothetical protein
MSRISGLAFLVLAALGAWACSTATSPAPPVPVSGSSADLSALAGRWEGTYSSEATGRSGSIVFELQPGDKMARGDVLMIPKETGGAEPATVPSETIHGMPQVLTISFVSAEGGVLKGTMNPYRDPKCDCEVQTTFVGRLEGDTIAGTFTTTPNGPGTITTGHWTMSRKKKK